MKNFIKIVLIATIIITSGSCKYQRLRKSKDPDFKTQKAHEFYLKGKYAKALPLYEDVILIKRNTQNYQDILYRYADCYYKVKDYILAGYYFRQFVETYPKGKYTEEAQYMSAYCYYLDAPKVTLDQSATVTALNEFGKFISKFPNSPKFEQCNDLIDELRYKLETKSFNNASLYYNLEEYKAAIAALQNSLKDYPDTPYEEKIRYLILKSAYYYAKNSILSKQKERYQDTEKYTNEFLTKFPDAKKHKEAEKILQSTKKALQNLNSTEI